MKTTLIYCAAGNKQYVPLAIAAGYEYGARLPDGIYYHPEFVDQDWERPNRAAYIAALSENKPRLATVLDWQRLEQLSQVLAWAEEAAAHVQEAVIIIPKVDDGIRLLPRSIGGKQVRLGYSVPTSYAGTQTLLLEFCGWPVHLLGGSPKNQLHLAHWLDVRSADGNYFHHKIKYGQFFDGKRWIQLSAAGIHVQGADIPTTVINLSLPNIVRAWASL